MTGIRVLGPLEIDDGSGRAPLAAPMPRRLAAALLVERDHLCSATRLREVLWPAGSPASAAKVLHTYICGLRHRLPDGVQIETIGASYRLHGDWPMLLDAARFEQLIDATGGVDPRTAAALLREAISLRRGPAFEDFGTEPFAMAEAARLDELYRTAVTAYLEATLALDHQEQALATSEAVLREHPFSEHLVSLVMLARYRSGAQGAALQLYDHTRRLLRDELGVDPGPELQQRFSQVLRHDPVLWSPVEPMLHC